MGKHGKSPRTWDLFQCCSAPKRKDFFPDAKWNLLNHNLWSLPSFVSSGTVKLVCLCCLHSSIVFLCSQLSACADDAFCSLGSTQHHLGVHTKTWPEVMVGCWCWWGHTAAWICHWPQCWGKRLSQQGCSSDTPGVTTWDHFTLHSLGWSFLAKTSCFHCWIPSKMKLLWAKSSCWGGQRRSSVGAGEEEQPCPYLRELLYRLSSSGQWVGGDGLISWRYQLLSGTAE